MNLFVEFLRQCERLVGAYGSGGAVGEIALLQKMKAVSDLFWEVASKQTNKTLGKKKRKKRRQTNKGGRKEGKAKLKREKRETREREGKEKRQKKKERKAKNEGKRGKKLT